MLPAALLVLAGLATLCAGRPARAAGESVWELTPYHVEWWLVFADHPAATPRLRESLGGELQARGDALLGAAWDLRVRPAPVEFAPLLAHGLERLSTESLPPLEAPYDKLVILVVRPTSAGYDLVARDWDQRCRVLSPPVALSGVARDDLPSEGLRLGLTAFAPLASVDQVEGRTAKLRLRAGGLPLGDPNLVLQSRTGLYRSIVRVSDRSGAVQSVKPVEWTLLETQSVEGSLVTCQMHSGLRGALGDRRRGRVERLALGIPPVSGETVLEIRAAGPPDQPGPPLAGYQVLGYSSGSKQTEPLGTSDARGRLAIGPGPQTLRLLLVMNGSQPLAKLPLVPGLAPAAVAQVPNDDRRLEVEGFVAGLQESMVDLVVRREVLLALAKQKIEAGQVPEAQELVDQLRRLPSRQQFAFRVQQEEQRLATDDPRVKRRVDRLFGDTRTLLAQYLDPRAVDQVDSDLVRLRNRVPAPQAEGESAPPATPPAEAAPPTAAAAPTESPAAPAESASAADAGAASSAAPGAAS